jgi:mannosyltransferase OCH1-like enzyme
MQVSQIYLSDTDAALPPYIGSCVQAVRGFFPEFDHVLYNIRSAREFLNKEFGKEVLAAFDKLKPYAYKADLLRYCLLHQVGGWYFDVACRPLTPISVADAIETIAFRDMPIFHGTGWSCVNAVIYSRPKSAVFSRALELVLKNCNTNYYGINAICPTGPAVLGRAFALEGESESRVFGEYMFLTPMHQNRNAAFVLPDGVIFAMGKPADGGDLTSLGASGVNNYNDFYNSRSVYR